MEKFIEKSRFEEFLKELSGSFKVFVPKITEHLSYFGPWEGERFSFDYQNTKKPPKELFFPQCEILFSFTGNDVREPELNEEKRVVVGMRPCDAKGVKALDYVFLREPVDPYYKSRRENTVIVSLACNEPCSTCFCTSVGASPVGEEGSDILMTDTGDGLFLKPITEKGENLIKDSKVLEDPDETHKKTVKKLHEKALSLVEKIEISGIDKKLDTLFESDFFDKIYKKCVGCGICTYLCPTCHCFDIDDETKGEKGIRVRLWDSCMYPVFTLQASGFNPRPTGKERWRQRLMHKFNYYVKNFNTFGCVGCGRCVKYCPVNLDIRKVLKDALEES